MADVSEKIEAVARALCRFESRDPDQKTRQPGGRVGFQAHVGDGTVDGPALWESYKAEAERFVIAAEALEALRTPVEVTAPEVKRW